MHYQVIALALVFVFVQSVNSQDPCDQAIETLKSSAVCDTSYAYSICLKADCFNYFQDIINNCDDQVSPHSYIRS